MISKETLESEVLKLREYRHIAENERRDKYRWEFCLSVLAKMEREFDKLEFIAPYSLFSWGNELENYIGIRPISDELYIICAWFVREMLLHSKRHRIERIDLSNLWGNFSDDENVLIDDEHKFRRDYILNGKLDIDIINFYLGDKSYQAFLNYEQNVTEAEEKIQLVENNLKSRTNKLENFLVEKERKVNELAAILEKQETAFNFVGLSEGFRNLLRNKESAKWLSFFILLAIGGGLCLVPYAYIRTIMDFSSKTINDPYMWKLSIPFTGLEIILLYFFRVTLNHYNSLQTQIMQLELRQSLCQFIQSYADYAKEIKEKDGASLEKFENLIFSSILSTPDKVPSTFDGLDQLANFVKEIKKG